jgi:hypothetical protein
MKHDLSFQFNEVNMNLPQHIACKFIVVYLSHEVRAIEALTTVDNTRLCHLLHPTPSVPAQLFLVAVSL